MKKGEHYYNIVRPFLRGLFSEGFIFGGAYLRREICVSKSIGLALQLDVNLPLFYFVFEGNFPISSPQGAYIWRSNLTEGFLRYRFWGAYIWRGLYMEGLTFGLLR